MESRYATSALVSALSSRSSWSAPRKDLQGAVAPEGDAQRRWAQLLVDEAHGLADLELAHLVAGEESEAVAVGHGATCRCAWLRCLIRWRGGDWRHRVG
jgi:hypothetical protein